MPIHGVSNACIFDGHEVKTSANVLFQASPGDIISIDSEAIDGDSVQSVIDGTGCTLLPAFIDANINTAVFNQDLHTFASYGIATVLDMSSSTVDIGVMRAESAHGLGLPLYLASGPVAIADIHSEKSLHPRPETITIHSLSDIDRFLATSLDGPSKSDYIKVHVDLPGFDAPYLAAIVCAVHLHGKLAVAHTLQKNGYSRALDAGFDIIVLVPIDGLIDDLVVNSLAKHGVACIPTLCMAQAITSLLLKEAGDNDEKVNFGFALANVKKLYDAGVSICAGSEANQTSNLPIPIGEGLHAELELLVRAGLSNLDALRAGTVIPAKVFGLGNRGTVSPGKRADLVLIQGNPLDDIASTRRIQRVWIGGIEIIKQDEPEDQ